eukprot:614749_1
MDLIVMCHHIPMLYMVCGRTLCIGSFHLSYCRNKMGGVVGAIDGAEDGTLDGATEGATVGGDCYICCFWHCFIRITFLIFSDRNRWIGLIVLRELARMCH